MGGSTHKGEGSDPSSVLAATGPCTAGPEPPCPSAQLPGIGTAARPGLSWRVTPIAHLHPSCPELRAAGAHLLPRSVFRGDPTLPLPWAFPGAGKPLPPAVTHTLSGSRTVGMTGATSRAYLAPRGRSAAQQTLRGYWLCTGTDRCPRPGPGPDAGSPTGEGDACRSEGTGETPADLGPPDPTHTSPRPRKPAEESVPAPTFPAPPPTSTSLSRQPRPGLTHPVKQSTELGVCQLGFKCKL